MRVRFVRVPRDQHALAKAKLGVGATGTNPPHVPHAANRRLNNTISIVC